MAKSFNVLRKALPLGVRIRSRIKAKIELAKMWRRENWPTFREMEEDFSRAYAELMARVDAICNLPREVVISSNYGGFALSAQGLATYCSLKGIPCFFFREKTKVLIDMYEGVGEYELLHGWPEHEYHLYAFSTDDVELIKQEFGKYHISQFGSDIRRDDPCLVDTVKLLGKYAGDSLKIVSIPRNVEWEIQEYDGMEWVAEKHRRWS